MGIVASVGEEVAQEVRRRMLRRLIGGDEVNPGERWFNLETSPAEWHALFHLEWEMDATLMFEHRGNQRASQLWVTKIILGRLFRESLIFHWVVKSFAKFQCPKIMRGLVKLNELEEVSRATTRRHARSLYLGSAKR